MPNWCFNVVTIKGSNDDLEKVLTLVKESEPFNAIHPMPEGVDWYEWRVTNWGTKWEADEIAIDVGDGCVTLTFASAWAPPEGVTVKLAELFPALTIAHAYEESGMNFTGIIRCADGRVVQDIQREMEPDDFALDSDDNDNPNYVPLESRF